MEQFKGSNGIQSRRNTKDLDWLQHPWTNHNHIMYCHSVQLSVFFFPVKRHRFDLKNVWENLLRKCLLTRLSVDVNCSLSLSLSLSPSPSLSLPPSLSLSLSLFLSLSEKGFTPNPELLMGICCLLLCTLNNGCVLRKVFQINTDGCLSVNYTSFQTYNERCTKTPQTFAKWLKCKSCALLISSAMQLCVDKFVFYPHYGLVRY